ncbi:ABC transporter substrate-binding protein [Falsiroseomonas oryziterrae]|uniref:ABC transporter substrate-binding protein n=1 Tax=Falsiroseomonas oryziterrae TaxID=2911368 RepID=UPI001F217149|nr:ABC transporter substrate-binding protein [Roseomonas sp. NPKOSM-4]
MTPITLQEPFRAVFYTPFYAALARGDFAAAGVEVKLITVGEPDRAVANLLSGAADLAWSGPMRVIRDHAANPGSPLVSFGAVVMGDPFLLVGRAARSGFALRDLAGLSLGVVSEVPTPWWCLQRDLRRAGVDPAALRTVTGRGMAENAAAVMAGALDVAQLFEPFASQLEAQGAAVWHAQAARGPTSYTAFYATRGALAAKREAMRGMVRGLAAMQRWLHAATPEQVAETVAPFFDGLDRATLARAVARYRDLGIWSRTPRFPRDAFEDLQAAMLDAGAITRAPGFEACVDAAIVEEALA